MGLIVKSKPNMFLVENKEDCCDLRLDTYGLEKSQKMHNKRKNDKLHLSKLKSSISRAQLRK